MKVYSLTVRNRFTATLLGVAALGLGAALLVVGAAILAGLAVAGGVLGTGFVIYNRLRGGRSALAGAHAWRSMQLDPSLEVFPDARRDTDRALPVRTDID